MKKIIFGMTIMGLAASPALAEKQENGQAFDKLATFSNSTILGTTILTGMAFGEFEKIVDTAPFHGHSPIDPNASPMNGDSGNNDSGHGEESHDNGHEESHDEGHDEGHDESHDEGHNDGHGHSGFGGFGGGHGGHGGGGHGPH